jgi:D-tyrosyl-tRNA(Tyr) deacylase
MKKSVKLEDIGGELLIISNFTLYGRNKKGGSIDFCHAAPYDQAEEVYNYLVETLSKTTIPFQTGDFGAMMEVSSVNSGPVNMVLEW